MTQLRVGLAQFAADETVDTNRERALKLATELAGHGAELVLLQELVTTQYFPAFSIDTKFFDWAEPWTGATISAFRHFAGENNVAVLVPWFERVAPGRYFNSAALVVPPGEVLHIWRKAHIPRVLVDEGARVEVDEKFYFEPSTRRYGTVQWRGVRVGALICHDRHFPEMARSLALDGAELVLVPAASRGVPGSVDPVATWRAELATMAFQNTLFVAATNRTGSEKGQTFAGSSGVWGPEGWARVEAGDEEGTLLADLDFTELETLRRQRGFLRDRRPELYTNLVHNTWEAGEAI